MAHSSHLANSLLATAAGSGDPRGRVLYYSRDARSVLLAAYLLEADAKPLSRDELLGEWDRIAPEFNRLKENTRQKISVEDLNLTPDGGVGNILKVYKQATPEEREYWGGWYQDASAVVGHIADRYDLELPIVAGVVAVLSPGNRWFLNVRIAEKLIMFWKNNALDIIGPLSAYPRNIALAVKILDTGKPSDLILGPKTSIFYDSLVDPVGVENSIVLDGHAVNIWRGVKAPVKEGKVKNEEHRTRMESDYSKAAKQLGVPGQSLQAITWYIWKFVTNPKIK